MSYKLFIDDERDPILDDWIVVRSSAEAISTVQEFDCFPEEISFDHDLGGEDTSMVFIKWFIDCVLDSKIIIPADFKYSVHSQNPVGAYNIKHKMDAIISFSKGGFV